MPPSRPCGGLARAYDVLYDSLFDAKAEAESLLHLIQQRRPGARDLLDVACGTGRHLAHLRQYYAVAGVDLEPAMLREARRKLPGVPLTRADVLELDLKRRFDVVTCLFSSLAYVRTRQRLRRAIRRLARHVRPGGLLVVDGWIRPEQWQSGYSLVHQASAGSLHIVRLSVSYRWRDISTIAAARPPSRTQRTT